MKIKIGKNIETNENVVIDLTSLIISRLLIQANAGGGKSWLLRKVLEESHGKVQQIIIDLEGEFSTLREEYDYLLCGRGGDIPIHIKTADLLARKILELNVSSIVDISELKKHERILFVKRFLDSLMEAPRKLWHPCIIVVDEAHQFCPQTSKSESASSVIDLMTRGRKRGFCGILATQRISKLHKDACAEANNRLIGRTGLDIDRRRASEELGFTSKEDERSLRYLEPGEFYAFGSSISKEIIKMKVGDVETSHPEAGSSLKKSSPTPENIKKILEDVIDLPKEVEEELKTKQGMQKRISELKIQLRVAEKSQKIQEKVQEKIINITDENALQKAKYEGFKESERFYKSYINPIEQNTKILRNSILKLVNNAQSLLESKAFVMVGDLKSPSMNPVNVKSKLKDETREIRPVTHQIKSSITPTSSEIFDGEYNLNLCARKIYSFLYQNPDRFFSKIQISAITSYSVKSGGFNNALGSLNTYGLIKREGGLIGIGEINQDLATEDIGDLSIELWLNKLGKCPREIFKLLLENPDNEFSKSEISEQTGYSERSGGFNNALGKLNSLGLIIRSGGMIKINGEILELQ